MFTLELPSIHPLPSQKHLKILSSRVFLGRGEGSKGNIEEKWVYPKIIAIRTPYCNVKNSNLYHSVKYIRKPDFT